MTIKKGPFPRETGLCIVFSFVRLQTRFPPAGHDKYNDTDEDRQRVPNGNDVRSQFHHDTSKLLHAMCDVNRRFFVDCRAKQPAHTPAHGAHATRPHARNRYVTPFQLPNDFYLTRRKKLKDGFMTQGLNLLFVPGTKFTTPLAPARGNCRVEKAPAQSYQHIHTYPQRRNLPLPLARPARNQTYKGYDHYCSRPKTGASPRPGISRPFRASSS